MVGSHEVKCSIRNSLSFHTSFTYSIYKPFIVNRSLVESTMSEDLTWSEHIQVSFKKAKRLRQLRKFFIIATFAKSFRETAKMKCVSRSAFMLIIK